MAAAGDRFAAAPREAARGPIGELGAGVDRRLRWRTMRRSLLTGPLIRWIARAGEGGSACSQGQQGDTDERP